jgi:ferredoxin
MVNGKATLLRDDYCDGLGDCLPTCPTGAIAFVEREAAAYDEEAVKANMAAKKAAAADCSGGGCPGSQSRTISIAPAAEFPAAVPAVQSRLMQWPVQIKLLPVEAPFYDNARLLIAADCTAFSRADFHERFMKGRITVIGCPKLDMVDYAEKLTEIIRRNNIREVTVVRMEVPCCGGIQRAVETALQNSGKFIPWQVVTLGRNGTVLD